VVEGSAEGKDLDHEVLKLIVSKKFIAKLMNGTEFGLKHEVASMFQNDKN
jgi:hypothetical protein